MLIGGQARVRPGSRVGPGSVVLQVVSDVLLVGVLRRFVSGLQQPAHIVVLLWKRTPEPSEPVEPL